MCTDPLFTNYLPFKALIFWARCGTRSESLPCLLRLSKPFKHHSLHQYMCLQGSEHLVKHVWLYVQFKGRNWIWDVKLFKDIGVNNPKGTHLLAT